MSEKPLTPALSLKGEGELILPTGIN